MNGRYREQARPTLADVHINIVTLTNIIAKRRHIASY